MISLRSIIAKKVLHYFFINPGESLYVNELSRKLRLDKRNLVKKLKELQSEGILASEMRGNLKLYTINTEYPLYKEYKRIVYKTFGVEANLKKALRAVEGIKEAYLYGSYASDAMSAHSDIDVLVIGNYDMRVLQRAINKLQSEIDREINVVNMDEVEFKKTMRRKHSFVVDVFSRKTIRII